MGLFSRTTEMLQFTRGPQTWRYTLGDRDVVYQQQTYTRLPGAKRGRIARTADAEQAGLDVTLPISTPVVSLLAPQPTSERVGVMLLHWRSGETNARVRWIGSVAQVSLSRTRATLKCRTPFTDMAAAGLTRNWQRTCPLTLYGGGPGQCNVNRNDFRVDGTVTGGSGVTLHAAAWAAKPDAWFRGGFIEWTLPSGAKELRFITDHVGDELTLLTPASVSAGAVVAAYPGCNHTVDDCTNKFHNLDNYGGQPNIPTINPMGGDMVF